MRRKHLSLHLAAVFGLSLLLSAPGFAFQQYQFSANRISTRGQITKLTRVGNQYRITLDHGAFAYYVPVSTLGHRDLRVGDRVRINGTVTNDGVNAEMVALAGEPYFARDPMYRGVPYGSSGWMSATVDSVNRDLNYLQVRDDADGKTYKVDLRHMNTLDPINVWKVRPGDHIAVRGSWTDNDLFRASRVEY